MNAVMEFFNLKEKPFSLTPDLDFFCNFEQYHKVLASLKANIVNGEALVIVSGEVGLGKTMLCRKLLHTLKTVDHIQTVYIPNPKMEPKALLSSIAEQLQIPMENKDLEHLINHINDKLIRLASEGKQVICAIDEAQVMGAESIETLRLLTNLETQKRKLLQIILFGQPELMNLLNRESLRQIKQRITYTYNIRPLTFSEAFQYVCRRLIIAGHPDGMLLTKGAQRHLYKYSRGIPRIINILLDKALMLGAKSGKNRIDHHTIKRVARNSPNLLQRKPSNFDETLLIMVIIAVAALSSILIYRVLGNL